MSVQRYRASNNPSDKADGRQYCYAQDDGDWVLYSDHQSYLAEREQRIAAYKLALEKADYEFAYGLYEEAKKTVRAALATEGEKREHT